MGRREKLSVRQRVAVVPLAARRVMSNRYTWLFLAVCAVVELVGRLAFDQTSVGFITAFLGLGLAIESLGAQIGAAMQSGASKEDAYRTKYWRPGG